MKEGKKKKRKKTKEVKMNVSVKEEKPNLIKPKLK